jgi:hypothetical protein
MGLGLEPVGVAAVTDDQVFALCRGWVCPDRCTRHQNQGVHEPPSRLYVFTRVQVQGRPGWQVQGLNEDLPHGLAGLCHGPARSLLSRTRDGKLFRIRLELNPRLNFWRISRAEGLGSPQELGPLHSCAVAGDIAVAGFSKGVGLVGLEAEAELHWLVKPPAAAEAKGDGGAAGPQAGMLVAVDGRERILALDQRTRCAFGFAAGSAGGTLLVKREQWPKGFRPRAAAGFGSQFFVAGEDDAGKGVLCAICPEADGTCSVRPQAVPMPAGGCFGFSPSGHLHVCDLHKGCIHRIDNLLAGLDPDPGRETLADPWATDPLAEFLKTCLATYGQGMAVAPPAGPEPTAGSAAASPAGTRGEAKVEAKVVRWMLQNAGHAAPSAGGGEGGAGASGAHPRNRFWMHWNPQDGIATLEFRRLDSFAGRIDPALARRLAAQGGRTGITLSRDGLGRFAYGMTVILDPEAGRFVTLRPGGMRRACHEPEDAEASVPGTEESKRAGAAIRVDASRAGGTPMAAEPGTRAEPPGSRAEPPASRSRKPLNPEAPEFVPAGLGAGSAGPEPAA